MLHLINPGFFPGFFYYASFRGDNGKIYMKEITLQFGGTYMKNSLVVKFFIWFFVSLFALVFVKQILYVNFPYNPNVSIEANGLVIIGLIIIFGLLILKKLDDLKHK